MKAYLIAGTFGQVLAATALQAQEAIGAEVASTFIKCINAGATTGAAGAVIACGADRRTGGCTRA